MHKTKHRFWELTFSKLIFRKLQNKRRHSLLTIDSITMAMSSRKSSILNGGFGSISAAILFVSLCYASSGVTAYEFSPSTLNLVNDTSAKYLNQTVPTNIARSRSKRSVVFPTGSDLTVTFAFQYPIQAVTGASKFVQKYDFDRKTLNAGQSV